VHLIGFYYKNSSESCSALKKNRIFTWNWTTVSFNE